MVREPKIHREVIEKVMSFVDYLGFDILHLDYSPIKGPEGNIEYLIHIRKNVDKIVFTDEITEMQAEEALVQLLESGNGYSGDGKVQEQILNVVARAHETLDHEKDGAKDEPFLCDN